MPFYDYRCLECGHDFDVVLSIKDGGSTQKCEKCGGKAEQVIKGIGSYSIKGDNSASTPPKTTVRARKSDV